MESGGIALLRRAALATLVASTAYGIGTGRLLRLGMPHVAPSSPNFCIIDYVEVDKCESIFRSRFYEVAYALHRYSRTHRGRLPTARALRTSRSQNLCRLLKPYVMDGPLDRPLVRDGGASLTPTLWLDRRAYGRKLHEGRLSGHFPVVYCRVPNCHTRVLYGDDL